MQGEPVTVTVENVAKDFGKTAALHGVSLAIAGGELIALLGPSGSGKTTLLSMLGGLLRPTKGAVEIDGVDITAMTERQLPAVRASKVGFIFQAFNLLDALTVEENVLFPARLTESRTQEGRARADALLDRLALSHRRKALPKTLSGGEKQRVAIARALINRPPLILADEPTGNLDSHSGQEVLMILHDIARDEGRSILIVTHDPRVEDVADRILWLEDGGLRDRKQEEHDWVTDPVCGMRVDAWTAVFFSEYQGQRYVFCSKRCEERFGENPASYIG